MDESTLWDSSSTTQPLLDRLLSLNVLRGSESGRTSVFVSIDGRSGAGKSTLAADLVQELPASWQTFDWDSEDWDREPPSRLADPSSCTAGPGVQP